MALDGFNVYFDLGREKKSLPKIFVVAIGKSGIL